MSLPENKDLNEFLDSVKLSITAEPKTGYFQIGERRLLKDASGQLVMNPLTFDYDESCKITLMSMVKRIKDELILHNHCASDEMAKFVIAISSFLTKKEHTSIALMNELISMIVSAKVSCFWIHPFAMHIDEEDFNIEDYKIGRLDRDRLTYWCRKVDCDYFERYPDHFQNNQSSIIRKPVDIFIIDWTQLRNRLSNTTDIITFCDYYFEMVTEEQRSAFVHDFHTIQEVFVAYGAPLIILDKLSQLGGSFIGIYTNFGENGKGGYFCPFNVNATLNFGQASRRYTDAIKEMKKLYNFTGFKNSEIYKSLGAFSHFLAIAKMHSSEGRYNEELIHLIIALDLLFGERDASTQKISKRTAMMVCRHREQEFDVVCKHMESLYDQRSCYVHAGKSVDVASLRFANEVTTEVLHCLLRLQSNPENYRDGFFIKWLKNIDLLIATVAAQKMIRDEDLISVGAAVGQ